MLGRSFSQLALSRWASACSGLLNQAKASVKWVQLRREVELIMQRAFGIDIPQTLDDICVPTRLALVVYDMQVGIVKQIENGHQITDFDALVRMFEQALRLASALSAHHRDDLIIRLDRVRVIAINLAMASGIAWISSFRRSRRGACKA